MSKRLFINYFDEDFKDTARFKDAVNQATLNEYANLYIKNNETATTVTTQSERYAIEGASALGAIVNDFTIDQANNAIEYTGEGGVFLVTMTFSIKAGNNDRIGVYIAKNTGGAINPSDDRISESEVYITTSGTAAQDRPVAASVQALLELSQGDKLYGIVQNTSSTTNILVNFMNLIATTL